MTIRLDPWQQEIDELQPGETIRVDHGTHCTAGEETRRRLYITRVMADPDKVMGYCHNCADGGRWTDKEYTPYRDMRHAQFYKDRYPEYVDEVVPPKGMVHSLDQWPTYAQSWAMSNRLTSELIQKYGLAFDSSSDRVYLPRYGSTATKDLNGYQLRLVTGRGPKYVTVSSKDDPGYTVIPDPVMDDKIIIVEDLVSGIHVADATTHDVIVNYGVKINPLVVAKANQYGYAAVWLDNDSPHVCKQADGYARTIALYGNTASYVVTEKSDPKHNINRDIRDILVRLW